jgi:hypothetical protein
MEPGAETRESMEVTERKLKVIESGATAIVRG